MNKENKGSYNANKEWFEIFSRMFIIIKYTRYLEDEYETTNNSYSYVYPKVIFYNTVSS